MAAAVCLSGSMTPPLSPYGAAPRSQLIIRPLTVTVGSAAANTGADAPNTTADASNAHRIAFIFISIAFSDIGLNQSLHHLIINAFFLRMSNFVLIIYI